MAGGGAELQWPIWIGVVCEDIESQRRFYRDVLGLRELDRGEAWVRFKLGTNLLELLQQSDRPQSSRRGYQIAFDVDDIATAREHLIARGVEPITGEIEGGEESLEYWCYFRDAEGNAFEIVQKLVDPPDP